VPLDGLLNAVHFGNVHAHPDNQEASNGPRSVQLNPVQPQLNPR